MNEKRDIESDARFIKGIHRRVVQRMGHIGADPRTEHAKIAHRSS